jgi:hypothetical protein
MRNWTEHGFSRLTAISDAGSTPAASTTLSESGDLRIMNSEKWLPTGGHLFWVKGQS